MGVHIVSVSSCATREPASHTAHTSFVLFQAYAPTIHSRNESELETDVVIATVASLAQNAFEAPLDEGDISSSTSTSKTASKGYEHLAEEDGPAGRI